MVTEIHDNPVEQWILKKKIRKSTGSLEVGESVRDNSEPEALVEKAEKEGTVGT